jgi:hypothetical protein
VKRVLRILLNSVTVLSLLLFVAMVVLWVRSYLCRDVLVHHYPATGNQWYVESARARIAFHLSRGSATPSTAPSGVKDLGLQFGTSRPPVSVLEIVEGPNFDPRSGTSVGRWGFRAVLQERRDPSRGLVRSWLIGAPNWAIAILFAILPAIRWRARRRPLACTGGPMCSNCGYDLRATPDRCPECGEPAPAASVKIRQ